MSLAALSLLFAALTQPDQPNSRAAPDAFAAERERMVKIQIAARGVGDTRVLAAMRDVPRHPFVPEAIRERAYDDTALPIGHDQTISQPYVVAVMSERARLTPESRVLEIGTGSGYQAAVLAAMGCEVYTMEIIPELAERATTTLAGLGYTATVANADGYFGWEEHAPFDGIIVTAGAPHVPETLRQQLKIGGRLIIPVGKSHSYQQLLRITRVSEDDFESEKLLPVRFVPLVGEEGWSSENELLAGRRLFGL